MAPASGSAPAPTAETPAGWTLETFKQPVPKEFVVDLEARAEEAMAALHANEQLAALRFRLVPGRMTEEAFWRVYFYRQAQLDGAGNAPAVLQ